MTKQFLILLLTIAHFKTEGQSSSKCNCKALVDVEYKKEIVVFDKPNGEVLKRIMHNIKEEDFLILTIRKDSLDYFYVDISYSIRENTNTRGWIKKTNAIGIYARNYSLGEKLNLYSRPNLTSKIISTIPEWTNQLYVITKCSQEWAYVKIKYKGQLKEGWLQPDEQCDNPYTTCN